MANRTAKEKVYSLLDLTDKDNSLFSVGKLRQFTKVENKIL